MRWYIKILVFLSIAILAVGCNNAEAGNTGSSDSESSSNTENVTQNDVNLGDKGQSSSSGGGGHNINTDINTSTGNAGSAGSAGNAGNSGNTTDSGSSSAGSSSNGESANSSGTDKKPHSYEVISISDIINSFYNQKFPPSDAEDKDEPADTKPPTPKPESYAEIGVEQILMAGLNRELNLKVGQQYKIDLSLLKTIYPNKNISYESSNKNIVNVDGTGALNAVSKGKATVTTILDSKRIDIVCMVQ